MKHTEKAIQAVLGNLNPLEVYIDLKAELIELEAAIKQVQDLAISEADKYAEKSFKYNGAIIEKRSSPAIWDYSECMAYHQAKERLKYIEKIAQAGGGADTDSGEVINRAIRIEGRAGIAVKFPKV